MFLKRVNLILIIITLFLTLPYYTLADKKEKKQELPTGTPVLWRKPLDITSRNLFYGPGGKEHEPKGRFKFIKEDTDGSQPKVEVEDEQGVRWKVKLGKEARPEIVATRLLWAVGYFTDENYYLPEMRVEGIEKLKRVHVSANKTLEGARLKRLRSDKRYETWEWLDNPFVGSKELNGLRVMMALINNWDLKPNNNSIYYDEKSGEQRYYIYDLGASFGKTGGDLEWTKGNSRDYAGSKFIERIKDQQVDFVLKTRSPFIFIINYPYYRKYAKIEKIAKSIPRADAKWIGQLLSQLSDEQIRDAFRAAQYKPNEVQTFVKTLHFRINELLKL